MWQSSRRNAEGYPDPTAYATLKEIDADEEERFRKVLHMIFDICELSGFKIDNRIILVDKTSGRVWK